MLVSKLYIVAKFARYTGTTHPFDYPYSWNECDFEQFIRNITPEYKMYRQTGPEVSSLNKKYIEQLLG